MRDKFLEKGRIISTSFIKFPRIDECLLIECTFCIENLANPDCQPWTNIFLYGLIFIIFLILACVIIKILRELKENLGFLCHIICVPFRCLNSTKKKDMDEEIALTGFRRRKLWKHNRRRNLSLGIPLAIIVIMIQILLVESVSELVGMTAKTEECYKKDGQNYCKINGISSLTIMPAGQRSALIIKNAKNEIIGSINIFLQTLTINCVAKNEGWHRTYQIITKTIKRCPSMGTCVNENCFQISPQKSVEELKEWENIPGTNYCIESDGFWLVRGCGLPGTACLFYRNMININTHKIYETFSCPVWEYRIKARIILEEDGKEKNETTVELIPGMTFKWLNISYTPTGVLLAPAPILATKFLTDGNKVAIYEPNELNNDLFCPDRKSAVNLNCSLDLS